MVSQEVQSSAPSPTIKVKVKCNAGGTVAIQSSHTTASAAAVCVFLPTAKLRKRVNEIISYYGDELKSCIYRTSSFISADIWAQAIGAEILSRSTITNEAEVEMNAVAKGGYLALDNGLYRLVPVEVSPTLKALKAFRRRILEKFTGEGEQLLQNAKSQAQKTLELAGKRIEEANKYKAELEASGRRLAPQWITVNKIPNRFDGRWCVGFVSNISLIEFVFRYLPDERNHPTQQTVKRWPAIAQPLHKTLLWVPLDEKGSYNPRNIMVDQNFNSLPHVIPSGACMDIADAPSQIQNPEQLVNLRSSFDRVMQKVDLNSLYSHVRYWPPSFIAALPPGIKDHVISENWAELRTIECARTTIVDLNQERVATWTTQP